MVAEMTPMADQAGNAVAKTKIFISYSRADGSSLAEQLVAAFEAADFEAYLDKHDIEKGEDWDERLKGLILKADTVVFIISPGSIRSAQCSREVDRTLDLGKRLIPVHWIAVPESEIPARLKRLNYTFFSAGAAFAEPFAELVRAIRQDLGWIREHTLIGEQAARWRTRIGNADDLLLRGSELAEALSWQARRKPDAPAITDAQRTFIKTSVVGEQRRLVRARRLKLATAILGTIVVAGAIAWSKEQWLKEQYFRLAHVRGHVLTASQEGSLLPSSPPFKECTACPTMVVVPLGTFQMGSVEGLGDPGEFPIHPVSIRQPFAVGKFEVTFAEWDACSAFGDCDGSVSANGWGRGRQPVLNISWEDANKYVGWLSRMTGKPYRLLSEAEWEYAARAGSQGYFTFGNDDERNLREYAWFEGNADRKSHPTGEKRANAFGLHDAHGNVKEWVQDCWRDDYRGAPSDGAPRLSGNCSRRVVRGGSWLHRARALRSASREAISIDTRRDDLGMRVARSITP
jgi:formylglycine-generating enzyme required for sulfatase activity